MEDPQILPCSDGEYSDGAIRGDAFGRCCEEDEHAGSALATASDPIFELFDFHCHGYWIGRGSAYTACLLKLHYKFYIESIIPGAYYCSFLI